jgi:hypothetical protein
LTAFQSRFIVSYFSTGKLSDEMRTNTPLPFSPLLKTSQKEGLLFKKLTHYFTNKGENHEHNKYVKNIRGKKVF